MRRKRGTEQDIEFACVSMDRQAHDRLQEFEDEIADRDDDQRSLVLEARAGHLDGDSSVLASSCAHSSTR